MSKLRSNKGLIITSIVLGFILVVVGGVVVAKQMNQSSSKTTQVSHQDAPEKESIVKTNDTDSATGTNPASPVADPQSLTSVDIAPMGITVYYSKGTPGFEYTVLKTTDKTEYVQFTSADLAGTKCTNDEGAFASIIKNPSANETQTTSQTVKVGSDTYGLSLPSTGCATNLELFAQYQTGFKNGFSSMKAIQSQPAE